MCELHFCAMNTRIEPAESGARWTTRSVGQSPRVGRVESLSGSARVDSTHVLPSGGVRGQTNSVKITEDVRRYAAQEGVAENAAIEHGLEAKSPRVSDSRQRGLRKTLISQFPPRLFYARRDRLLSGRSTPKIGRRSRLVHRSPRFSEELFDEDQTSPFHRII